MNTDKLNQYTNLIASNSTYAPQINNNTLFKQVYKELEKVTVERLHQQLKQLVWKAEQSYDEETLKPAQMERIKRGIKVKLYQLATK